MAVSNAYAPKTIEERWQAVWERTRPFRAVGPGEPGFDPATRKFYVLDMFPYPSGSGLHTGHGVGYVATDIIARRRRMEGDNVLHPMGWDAFGLPAEQYAIQTGKHPRQATAENTANFRSQLKRIGLSYDWEREVDTSDPRYYRWTQWLFLRLFERGLVYRTEAAVWWCEELKTVLANEEVINGRSERGNHPCVRRPLKQWMLRITAYADRLLQDLEGLDWPESIKAQQREWIGRSEGARIEFPLEHAPSERLSVFTTRPDTLWGATFMVVAPEHPFVAAHTVPERRAEVEAYVRSAAAKSELERTDLAKRKTGVFSGRYALNPLMDASDGRARLPVWIADYVLPSYGEGAIMSVPGHDERDLEFARRFDLPVREVVRPPEGEAGLAAGVCFTGHGTANASGPIDGLPSREAIARTILLLEERGVGEARIQYKIRDWLFSRQRYWGEPFPLLHLEDGSVVAVPESDLPVELPEMTDFAPAADGSPPLARAADWLEARDPKTGRPARRDTDTMPGWAGSCWYWLRFMDPRNDAAPFSPEAEAYFGPVDLYVGGASHAVMHLLYARFWHKVFYDEGLVSTPEPFQRLFNQGMIQAFAYQDARGRIVSPGDVEPIPTGYARRGSGEPVAQIVTKMAKSLNNVVNPDEIIDEWGADTFRLYEMFMGPLADSKPWNPRDIPGCRRFLDRVWRMLVDAEGDRPTRTFVPDGELDARDQTRELERSLNVALKRVDDSFAHFNFNTAIAALMSFVNEATKRPGALSAGQADRFVRALAPFAPHVAEELWSRMGHAESITRAAWPKADPAFLESDTFPLVVQVSGKVRGRVSAPSDASREELERLARELVSEQLAGKEVVKTVVVPGRLVNLVVRG